MTLPMWTPMDVVRLKRRVARLQSKSPVPQQPCAEHAAYRVGPYLICRSLSCPVLVVTEGKRNA